MCSLRTGSAALPWYVVQMITESYYWKMPLLRGAAVIRKYMAREDLTDAQFARVERELFIGFYAVRKLLEATGKVSAGTRQMKIDLLWHPKVSDTPIVDWYNRSEFWELYQMEAIHKEQRDLLYVAHRMVHSFIFMLADTDEGHGVYFTSDRDKETRLNFISTTEIVRAFETVGNDYPSGFHTWRDKDTGEMKWSVP